MKNLQFAVVIAWPWYSPEARPVVVIDDDPDIRDALQGLL